MIQDVKQVMITWVFLNPLVHLHQYGDWEQFLEDSHMAAFLLRKPVKQHVLPPGQLLVSWQALRFVLQQLVRVWDPNVIKTAQNSLKRAVSLSMEYN